MHYFEKNSLKMNGLYVVYNAGSIYEKLGQTGTMHLMEHLICKSFDDMQDELTNRNINFNAYTCEEIVVVFFTGLNTQLNSDVKTRILQRLTNGTFVNEENFNKEKEIVLQEYYNYFNDIAFGNITNNLRVKYNTNTVIGSAEDIAGFTYEDAQNIFDKFFKSPSSIVEVGKEKTDFSFVEYNDMEISKKRLKYGNYKNTIEALPTTDTNSVVVALSKKPISKKDYPYMLVLSAILSDGLNSPLYQELREKRGLIYSVYPVKVNYVTESLFMYVSQTTKDNANAVADIITDVLTNLDKYVTQDRFNDVINNCIIQLDINKIFQYEHPVNLKRNRLSSFATKKQFENLTLNKVIEIGKKYFSNLDIEVM